MNPALDAQLDALKQAAQAQTATYRSSRDQLHQAVVDAYLWWRDAEGQKGYLDGAYKAASIKTRKRGNSPNFYPLVRLIWNIDITKQAATVSNWARSLTALHDEFTGKPHLYVIDARADLINFIKDEGGLGAMRGEQRMTVEQLETEEREGLPQETRGRPKAEAPAAKSVLERKLDTAKAAPAQATIASLPTAHADANNLVVMLGRRNAAGQIEVIGTNSDDALVNAALDACTQLSRAAVTPSLRLIAEALEPHALPARLEKYRKRFFEDSEVEREVVEQQADGTETRRIELIKQATRLRFRSTSNDFLLSKAASDASLVTYAKPHQAFDGKAECILRGEDRSWIERELLNQQKLSLYTATPAFGLEPAFTKDKQRFALEISDEASEHKRKLYFYSKGSVPTESNVQPVIADPAALVFDWRLDATVEWLREFDGLIATPYIEKIRGAFDKPAHASLKLTISNTKLALAYWWDSKTKAYAESYELDYGTGASSNVTAGEQGFTGNAKDLALMFATLPTLPITSQHVSIQGNQHVMRIAYSTDLAAYETFIPAADVAGKRDATAFEQYGG
jgi:hypothetical protein